MAKWISTEQVKIWHSEQLGEFFDKEKVSNCIKVLEYQYSRIKRSKLSNHTMCGVAQVTRE